MTFMSVEFVALTPQDHLVNADFTYRQVYDVEKSLEFCRLVCLVCLVAIPTQLAIIATKLQFIQFSSKPIFLCCSSW